MKTWLVTGASGLLGANAAVHLSARNRVVGLARTVPSGAPVDFRALDLSRAEDRAGILAEVGADVVLHTAAVSSIDECERQPGLAEELNVRAAADLAFQASRAGARFIYISTDAVFDGSRGGYLEDDAPSPTTTYGRTKLAGERAVLEANPDALVARVNFYGWSPTGRRSIAEFFHSHLDAGTTVNGFEDVVVSTLEVSYLLDSLQALVDVSASGIVHVVSSQAVSKFDFGRALAATFGFDPELVRPARSTDHLAIQRGSRLDLSTAKIARLLGSPPPGQQEGLDRLAASRRTGLPRILTTLRT
jgi:dTDP-4-dehydrorhamnose reductase